MKKRHKHKLYNRWKSMMDRCYNPNHVKYKFYGGKGIRVCERWRDFWNFVEDIDNMRNGHLLYLKGYQLDKDKSGRSVYSLNNCCVITAEENRRIANEKQKQSIFAINNNEKIKFDSIAEASRKLNIKDGTLRRYVKNGKRHSSGYRFQKV
ncbi:hypothetical protein H9655_08260 [Cytobacillus sp. Sa5YUA1]|uniref:Nuclease-associated modular DNA-binding 1 domain-containing protein n=1 Tax=Cytobacillus stercorigallinarum TaxID=2762240 RepID=A0ABR8QNB2_9BACI|nr:NUMOD1 domain-containing DNA-binding protein [Cytobacillus stercorigallinarum]MBD7937022.1 hypothetical protein [Cytobacillus stercorigallinarum]